ncbi:hypothetical protein [Alteromonas australica]|uniref:hypothetical protein n=1 Tax=Alteromonas australica TaxID=589873 RepID=UPI000A8F9BD4|nr:hypothetical protein [Alteromonas australica]
MSEELMDYLMTHEPTRQEGQEFIASVREEERKFSETSRKLTPSKEDRERLFNL